jgi:hypothetical protein
MDPIAQDLEHKAWNYSVERCSHVSETWSTETPVKSNQTQRLSQLIQLTHLSGAKLSKVFACFWQILPAIPEQ